MANLEPMGFSYPAPVAGCIDIIAVPQPKTVKNRVHIDLSTTSAKQQASLVARLTGLGVTPAEVGQADAPWVVLADPEGIEFCVLTPGRADCPAAQRISQMAWTVSLYYGVQRHSWQVDRERGPAGRRSGRSEMTSLAPDTALASISEIDGFRFGCCADASTGMVIAAVRPRAGLWIQRCFPALMAELRVRPERRRDDRDTGRRAEED